MSAMNDLELDPAIAKLLEYAKTKKSISFDELSDFLPEHVLNSDKIDGILALLEANDIRLEEEEVQIEDEVAVKEAEAEKKRLVYNDKESSVDDPIRLYLREIGKENLLTAEQEVELSKSMEEGENIIKGIIKRSGVLIPEFFQIGVKATRREAKDSSLQRKENTEKIAERRRLNQFYRDIIRDCLADLKEYVEHKRHILSRGGDIFTDDGLAAEREGLLRPSQGSGNPPGGDQLLLGEVHLFGQEDPQIPQRSRSASSGYCASPACASSVPWAATSPSRRSARP